LQVGLAHFMTLSCGIRWCPIRGPIGLTAGAGGGSNALAFQGDRK
jgi:hypothetical protein